jgi:S-adenosylmethionine hydrolase
VPESLPPESLPPESLPPESLPVVSFLSDYGLDDEFVGVCKGVLLSLAPHVSVIDITHNVPAHDVRAGALTLVRAVQYLPTGVVLAVVDPGVGTDRRTVAVQVDDGYLVGPDNGLLAPATAMLGGPRRVVALTSEEHQLAAPGPTFAGRDVMAPAAAYLASGVPITDLGDEVDPAGLVPGVVSLPREEDGTLLGEVWWVDRFGNCQLNIGPDELRAHGAAPGGPVELRFRDDVRMARWVSTYADARPSELVVLVDSYGLISIALNRASAAEACRLKAGAPVTVVTPGGSA